MARIEIFHKMRDLRDREKQEHQKNYQRSVEVFEEKATLLYETLKEKEMEEFRFEKQLAEQSVQAMSFIQHQQYIERLEEKVKSLQPRVNQAREQMKTKQKQLTTAHVEVKKFEKIIEQKVEKQEQWVKEEESKFMDELSMQQYLNFQNR
ncbi:flagellar export protein FliJ [Halobacillus litoralis]|uniref:flagellar export protein FliJ n=1 Tax=Halobacillus litoralis TaxID=45668 RepID=UPI001CD5CCEC|nr:flagellar export protein FliJ [Halobacillus litoralis]MCA0969140.1 flagellar export protein FliJ [Halobacillus litoralis]